MSLLEAVITPPCTFAKQPHIAMEGRVRSLVCVERCFKEFTFLGTAEEVTSTTLMVLIGPSTAKLSPEDGPEVMAPLA